MEDQSLEVLKLQEQLLEIQIQKAKLLSKPSSSTTSSLPATATWGKNNTGMNYVSLGSIPRSSRNHNYPASASEIFQKDTTTVSFPVKESLATSSSQVAKTDYIPVNDMTSPLQTAAGKDKSNPLTPVALVKSKKDNRPKKNKPSSSNERKQPLPSASMKKKILLPVSRPETFRPQQPKEKSWKPNSKRPLDEENFSIVNLLFKNDIDIKLIRTLEKKLYQSLKTHIDQTLSFDVIQFQPECEYNEESLFRLLHQNDLETYVYPTFYFKKNWWIKIFKIISEDKSFDSIFQGINKNSSKTSKIDFRNLITIFKPSSSTDLWTAMNYGFLNNIKYKNLKDFKECPAMIREFASYCLSDGLEANIMVLSSSPVYQCPEDEHHLQFWLNNPPEELPGILILVEADDNLIAARPFGSTSITSTFEDQEDIFHINGLTEIRRFMNLIKNNSQFVIHSKKDRLTCIKRFNSNCLSRDNDNVINQHLGSHDNNDEISQTAVTLLEGIISNDDSLNHGSGPKDSLPTKENTDDPFNGPAKDESFKDSASKEDKAM